MRVPVRVWLLQACGVLPLPFPRDVCYLMIMDTPSSAQAWGFSARPCTSKVNFTSSFLREPSPEQAQFSVFRTAACMSRFHVRILASWIPFKLDTLVSLKAKKKRFLQGVMLSRLPLMGLSRCSERIKHDTDS